MRTEPDAGVWGDVGVDVHRAARIAAVRPWSAGERPLTNEGYVGPTSIREPGPRPSVMEGKCSCRRPRGHSSWSLGRS